MQAFIFKFPGRSILAAVPGKLLDRKNNRIVSESTDEIEQWFSQHDILPIRGLSDDKRIVEYTYVCRDPEIETLFRLCWEATVIADCDDAAIVQTKSRISELREKQSMNVETLSTILRIPRDCVYAHTSAYSVSFISRVDAKRVEQVYNLLKEYPDVGGRYLKSTRVVPTLFELLTQDILDDQRIIESLKVCQDHWKRSVLEKRLIRKQKRAP